jgi:NAD(P)-dependent dehydrogenase (short-subunit alcohol dehydrogenase family)
MTDLTEKTVLVTGATDGLGRGIVHHLAQCHATVLVHGRDAVRAEALAVELRAAGATAVRSYVADLASLAQVRRLAGELVATEPRLDVVVNNAGIGSTVPTAERMESCDGIELRFAVNYLAHYVLTRALLPLLKASPPSRIVHVVSAGQAPIDFTDPMITRGYSGARAYCQSTLAQIMFTFDQHARRGRAGDRAADLRSGARRRHLEVLQRHPRGDRRRPGLRPGRARQAARAVRRAGGALTGYPFVRGLASRSS